MMNIFFIICNKAITPHLSDGTILHGITRESVMQLLKEMGFTIEERKLSIDEIVSAYKEGILLEVFGTGTAATISLIRELCYKDFVMNFDVDTWKLTPSLKQQLTAIR